MNQTHFYSSKLKYLGFLLICLMFVAIGGLMVSEGETLIGWASIGFFGLGIPIFIWQIVDTRPRLTLNDQGVIDRTLGVGLIAWTDIQGMYVRTVHKNDFICLEMNDESNERYLNEMGGLKRKSVSANLALGFAPINLNLSGIKGSTEEVLDRLVEYINKANAVDSNSG